MEVRAFQALPFTGTNGLQQDVVVEGIPLDFLNLMMTEEMMESTACTFLSPSPPPLSLSLALSLFLFPSLHPRLSVCLSVCLSLGNKPTETYSESKKTYASVTLAGACEVINLRGIRGADHQLAIWCYLQCGQRYQNYL